MPKASQEVVGADDPFWQAAQEVADRAQSAGSGRSAAMHTEPETPDVFHDPGHRPLGWSGAGMRLSEAAHLKIADIDSSRMQLNIACGKGAKQRLVPLSPRLRYSDLLAVLRDIGGNELATWVYGIEPDNALAVIDRVWSLGDAYSESDQLRNIERSPAPEGGGSYLMLLPKSKQRMLMNEYDHERLTIYLHGDRQFIAQVASRVNAEPQWEYRSPDA